MKSNVLKYYIATIYLFSTFMIFAQSVPGSNDDNSALEGADTPATPIDDSIWVLGFLGLLFVFLSFKAKHKKETGSQA